MSEYKVADADHAHDASAPPVNNVAGQNVAPSSQQQPTPLNLLREHPGFVYCPVQGRLVNTRVDSKDSDKTWLAVFGFALICICIACIPLKGCCGAGMFQDWDQFCEGCGKQLTHMPYNKVPQVLAPDHDMRDNAQGEQHGATQPNPQTAQMAYQ